MTAKAQRDELLARAHHYLSRGHSEHEAQEMAERELAAREARKLADELELEVHGD